MNRLLPYCRYQGIKDLARYGYVIKAKARDYMSKYEDDMNETLADDSELMRELNSSEPVTWD